MATNECATAHRELAVSRNRTPLRAVRQDKVDKLVIRKRLCHKRYNLYTKNQNCQFLYTKIQNPWYTMVIAVSVYSKANSLTHLPQLLRLKLEGSVDHNQEMEAMYPVQSASF